MLLPLVLQKKKPLQKMPGDPEVASLDTELTRLEVGGVFLFFVLIYFDFSVERPSFLSSFFLPFQVSARQMVQDFPLCATFREIDQQNSLVRGEMDNMREKLLLLDNLALEQVHIKCSPLLRV